MNYHLAQLNVAKMKYDLEDPRMKDFVDNLDPVNAHADQSEGFIWRMQDEAGNNTALQEFGADVLVNLSVWEDIKSFRKFVATMPHAPIMKRRGEWFDKMETPHMVLWWVPEGHVPTVLEAKERLQKITEHGPGEYAFSLAKVFASPA